MERDLESYRLGLDLFFDLGDRFSQHFVRFDQLQGLPTEDAAMRYAGRPLLIIPRHGAAKIRGEEILPGGCGLAMNMDDVAFDPGGTCLIAQPCLS